MGGKGPNLPQPEPVSIPAPLPTLVDDTVRQSGDDERRRRANASGRQSTVLTGSTGLASTANTAKKTLLGG